MESSTQSMTSQGVFEKYIASRVWAKNYDEGVPTDVEIRPFPLYEILDKAVKEYPDREAQIFFGRGISYRTLGDHSDRLAKAFKELGVGKGDVIAIHMPNNPAYTVTFFAALKIGAVVSPMNPLYTPREIAYHLKSSGSKILVTSNVIYKNAEQALKDVKVERVIVSGIEDYMSPIMRPLARMKLKPPKISYSDTVLSYMDLIKSHSPSSFREKIDPSEDLAALMYTGGTTGTPKGAMILHANISANLQQLEPLYNVIRKKRGYSGPLRFIGLLPWYHIYGLITVMIYAVYDRGTVIVFPRPDIEGLMKAVEKYKAHVLHGVPTLYNAINNHPKVGKYKLNTLFFCVSGAAPLPLEVARRFEKLTGAVLREGYGLTETAVVTHVNPLYGKNKLGSIGIPIPNTYAAIADLEKPELLSPGSIGEIVISGPQVMKGYNIEEENKLAFFTAHGLRWFRTGDIGYMDEEGYFYVLDRKKEMIKYKGYSVYPREIEEVLLSNECVKEAAVVGIPSPDVGEIPKAFVVLKDACVGKIKEDDLLKWIEDKLAPYKRPKSIEFRGDLPKSPVGKILRRVLRDEELKRSQK
ncbi:MAG: long-chain fatty acid--CoA ligase [Sulfolobales archaeon]